MRYREVYAVKLPQCTFKSDLHSELLGERLVLAHACSRAVKFKSASHVLINPAAVIPHLGFRYPQSFLTIPCMSWHAMQIFFEANTADFAKRKRVARACATCQKRKKRCNHVFKDQESPDDPAVPVLAHKEPVRFVGDLNPESVLRDLSTREKGAPRECAFGVFVDPALQAETHGMQLATSPNELNGRKCSVVVDRHGKIDRGFRTLSIPEKAYLQSVGAFRKLPKTTEDILITTWFSCIDGIIPILDGVKFFKDYAAKPASKVSPFLILAICLITCKTGKKNTNSVLLRTLLTINRRSSSISEVDG